MLIENIKIFDLMSLKFEKQSPKDLWQDFGCIKDSSIELTIYDIEREIEKMNSKLSNSTKPYKIPFLFSFQGQHYRIRYIPKTVLQTNASDRTILPFLFSKSIYQKVHLLFGIEEAFFIFYSEDAKIDEHKSLNLNRILQTLYLHQNFPLFVELSSQNDFTSYIGNIMKPKVRYTYSSRIEERENSQFTRLFDICKRIENDKLFSKNKLNLTFSVRDIYHFKIHDKLNMIICSEWPDETDRYLKLDFKTAKRHIMSIYKVKDKNQEEEEEPEQNQEEEEEDQEDAFYQKQFSNAFYNAENHGTKFSKSSAVNESKFEDDFALEEEMKDMKIEVKFAPSYSILTFFAQSLLINSEFDVLWFRFLKYVRKCIETRHEIIHVGFNSVDLNDCLIYQKLVLINIAIHKIKLVEKTSNYSLTSDMIEEADKKIRNACIEIDSNITDDQIVKLRKEIFPKVATNQPIQNYLKKKTGKNKEICKAAWNVVQSSWFDPEYLCECCADYLETLEPYEVLKPLLFILIIERYNDFYDTKTEMSNQIDICLNQLKFEMDVLSIHEFVRKCKKIERMIEKYASFKDFYSIPNPYFNSQSIVKSLFDKNIIVFEKKEEKEIINQYFHKLNINEDLLKHEHQFIVFSSFQSSGVNLEQRTFVLNDLKNSKVIVASSTKEEFLY